MAVTSFDRFFLNLPPLDMESDFELFWKKSVAEIKKIPLDSTVEKNSQKSSSSFNCYDCSFKGFMKTVTRGELYIPKKKLIPSVIIHAHDYNRKHIADASLLNEKAAHFVFHMRGHDFIDEPAEKNQKKTSPGFMTENLMDRDTYYLRGAYLDLFRSIDMLRLINEIDCGSVGLIGRGLGCAASLFTAVYSERVKAIVLDSPSFVWLEMFHNLSSSEATEEISGFITQLKTKKNSIKQSLSYFDALNFSEMISIPVLAVAGLKDTLSPPECTFALFNHMLTEKTAVVYPEEGNTPGGPEQYKKSQEWVLEKINSAD